ncbi:MAG: hypothetical protein JRF48_12740 [Deltaproteobacteria bacterium]|nr:hypothetical protein [Deltaproteobacteria bacterium]MBW1875903.1 hypothetical protein [Deltaproteobacteria bacterium]MBW2215261.1 hypothetical protein [Deltaproteobacteria bacterium]MBW2380806.1 hypothetical protein [Deltaproteobacteria bacterium]MBW2551713.1 hypothetical protein [Deltaproteobacteria bacterium]
MWRWLLIMVAFGVGCAGRQTPDGQQEVVVSPIPIPQPVYPRAELSTDLQELWSRVEEAVAVRPPQPPAGATAEVIESWAEGAFRDWLRQRQVATDRALAATHALRTHPLFERGIGTALFGYMYEDLAGSIRGAPVPDNIAQDKELLEIYTNALTEHLTPFAELSARAYYACLALFIKLDDPQWGEWAYYCDQRGAEVVDTFKLEPPEPTDPNTTLTQLLTPP